MQEFCHDVAVEPPSLQPLSGESISPNSAIHDDAWADIHGPDEKSAIFDFRVFHPNAPSYCHTINSMSYLKSVSEMRK